MSRSHGRPGFTLLEVLAAIVLLGLLVAAVTPLLMQAGGTEARLEERLRAEVALGVELATAPLSSGDGTRPVASAPGWDLEWTTLSRTPGVADDQLAHRWVRVRVRGGSRVVAECLLPVAAPRAEPPAEAP